MFYQYNMIEEVMAKKQFVLEEFQIFSFLDRDVPKKIFL